MIATLQVSRLSTGSVFKLTAIGMFYTCIPFGLLLGVLAAFGAATVNFQGNDVTGVMAIPAAALVAAVMAALATLFVGGALAFGLRLHALLRPLELHYYTE